MTATITHPAITPAGSVNRALRAFRDGLVRFTGKDMLRMMQIGVIPEDSTIELLDGILVYRDCGDSKGRPGTAGIDHDYVVSAISDLSAVVNSATCCLRAQITLCVSETYVPIPDAMILHGPTTTYRKRQPVPANVLCVIEVADSSYERDAGEKRAAYAAAGIGCYIIIIDLRNRTAEVCTGPDTTAATYPPPVIVPASGSIPLRVGETEVFEAPLGELLP
jgi:hypothetical protein